MEERNWIDNYCARKWLVVNRRENRRTLGAGRIGTWVGGEGRYDMPDLA
jgi:hypothetical protein